MASGDSDTSASLSLLHPALPQWTPELRRSCLRFRQEIRILIKPENDSEGSALLASIITELPQKSSLQLASLTLLVDRLVRWWGHKKEMRCRFEALCSLFDQLFDPDLNCRLTTTDVRHAFKAAGASNLDGKQVEQIQIRLRQKLMQGPIRDLFLERYEHISPYYNDKIKTIEISIMAGLYDHV